MKKILFVSILALGLVGCNSTTNSSNSGNPGNPDPGTPPVENPGNPNPGTPPGQEVPDIGVGSIKYVPSCKAGFAKVHYVFRTDSTIDVNSFIIVHLVDGQSESITQGSVNSNGSVSNMVEDIYISENTYDVDKAHQVQVKFVSDGLAQVDTFAFMQPFCGVDIDPVPEEPVVDPQEPVYSTVYAADTNYKVGDIITIVDGSGAVRTYRCIHSYRSGPDGDWDEFQREVDEWTRIQNAVFMKVEIS